MRRGFDHRRIIDELRYDIVGVALRVFVVKTFFTDRYHDILYTFCVLAAVVGTVGTVEKP